MPPAPRVQPLAQIGPALSCITSTTTNAAGKWQVNFRVEAEAGIFDVAFQLAPGDEWNPQSAGQPGTPLVLKVVSIKNNELEVIVLNNSRRFPVQ